MGKFLAVNLSFELEGARQKCHQESSTDIGKQLVDYSCEGQSEDILFP